MESNQVGLKKVAVMCLLDCGSEFLLLKRNKDPHVGKYIPIGGKIDPFETPCDAIIREVKEESHIIIKAPSLVGMLVETSPVNFNWVSFIYRAKIEKLMPLPCDEGVLDWIPYTMLSNVPTPEADVFIYDLAKKGEYFHLDAQYDECLNLLLLTNKITETVLFRRDYNS